jgi:hypothetical protein
MLFSQLVSSPCSLARPQLCPVPVSVGIMLDRLGYHWIGWSLHCTVRRVAAFPGAQREHDARNRALAATEGRGTWTFNSMALVVPLSGLADFEHDGMRALVVLASLS